MADRFDVYVVRSLSGNRTALLKRLPNTWRVNPKRAAAFVASGDCLCVGRTVAGVIARSMLSQLEALGGVGELERVAEPVPVAVAPPIVAPQPVASAPEAEPAPVVAFAPDIEAPVVELQQTAPPPALAAKPAAEAAPPPTSASFEPPLATGAAVVAKSTSRGILVAVGIALALLIGLLLLTLH